MPSSRTVFVFVLNFIPIEVFSFCVVMNEHRSGSWDPFTLRWISRAAIYRLTRPLVWHSAVQMAHRHVHVGRVCERSWMAERPITEARSRDSFILLLSLLVISIIIIFYFVTHPIVSARR